MMVVAISARSTPLRRAWSFAFSSDSGNCRILRESVSRINIRCLGLLGFLLGGFLLGRSLLGPERIPPLATQTHGLIERLGIVRVAPADLFPPGYLRPPNLLQLRLQSGDLRLQVVDLLLQLSFGHPGKSRL